MMQDSLSISKIHEILTIVQEAFKNERSELEAEIALLQTTMDTESEVISRGNTPRGDNISESFGYSSPPRGISKAFQPEGDREGGSRSKLTSTPLSPSANSSAGANAPVHKSVVILGPGRIRRCDSRSRCSNESTLSQSLSNPAIGSKVPPRSSSCYNSSQTDSSALTQSLHLKLTELESSTNNHAPITSTSTVALSQAQNGPSPSSSGTNSRSNSGNGSTRSRMRSRIETARDERFFMDDDIFLK